MWKIKLWEIISTLKWFAFKTGWMDSKWIPLVKVSNFTDNSISLEGIWYIQTNTASLYTKYQLTKWDILIQTVWSWPSAPASVVWKVVSVPRNLEWALLNQNIVKIIPNSGIDNSFLYYLLKNEAFKNHVIWWAQWAASQASITLEHIKNFELILPELLIQRKIAWVLSNYDNFIENNNRRIQILEQTAQEIHKEWFVNFRFPWHETIKMIDSETDFWEIPEGWNIENLWDRIKILKWKNITRATITLWDIPVVAWWISPAYYHNKPNVNWPVITISASGANAGYIRLYHQDIWASDCSYISKDNSKFIYYYFLLLKDRQINITNLQVGSAQPHVYPKDIISFKVIVPNNDIIADFETKITPIFHELSNLENQNNNLIKTRDLLLPKLISWEIDISELEIL